MRRHLPPLNALRAFEASARYANFTHAARELGVAQPAITRHISNLEDWLGVKLFSRTGNAVSLTADGYEVSELITPIFDRPELGLEHVSQTRRKEIIIGASFGITHLWLMPQITAMRDAAKGAAINFLTSENYADFDSARVDLSVRFGTGDWVGKQSDLIFTETTYIIASPSFLAANPELDPENPTATLQSGWLLEHGDPYKYGWMTWQLWFEHHDVPPPATRKMSDVQNYPTLLDMVRCGEGIALGYVGLDDHLVARGDIVRVGKPLHRPNQGYYLVSNKTEERKKHSNALQQALLEHFSRRSSSPDL